MNSAVSKLISLFSTLSQELAVDETCSDIITRSMSTRLRTPTEVFKEKKASSHDMTFCLLSKLSSEFECTPIFIEVIESDFSQRRACLMTHSLIIIHIASKYYYIEWNWLNVMRGVNGPFDSMYELFAFIRRTYESSLIWKYARNDLVLTLRPFVFKPGMNIE